MPWSTFWDRNYFVAAFPALGQALTSNFTRGAVSGLGLVNLLAALAELTEAFAGRGTRGLNEDDADSVPHH